MFSAGRLESESKTVEAMIRLYCRREHGAGKDLCRQCRDLRDYACKRLAACPFQEGKTTCGNCPVHCYKPTMRARVRRVMREIGPRMIFHHPLMAIRHFIDGLRKRPKKRKG